MSRADFWSSTYREILCALHGYRLRESDRTRESWQQTRAIAYYAIVAQAGSKAIGSMEAFMPFPWEHKPKDHTEVMLDAVAQAAMMERLKMNVKIHEEMNRKNNIKKPKKS